jgi:hypothetical protein
MENETEQENPAKLSVAILNLEKKSYKRLDALNNQVAAVAWEKPDLLIIPKYPFNMAGLDKTLEEAKKEHPYIGIFTQTRSLQSNEQYAQRIDPWTQYSDKNPLRGLKYEVLDFPQKGVERLNLDMMVLFGGEKTDRESPAFKSIRPEGILIQVIEDGSHEVFRKHMNDKIPGLIGNDSYNNTVTTKKKTSDRTWYDLEL